MTLLQNKTQFHPLKAIASSVALKRKNLNWPTHPTVSHNCRLCRHYQPTGRRGGTCQLLSVSVKGTWKACAVAESSF